MDFDGVFADAEFAGNVSVGQAPVEHQNQLFLAFRELGVASGSDGQVLIVVLIGFFFCKETGNCA